MKSQNVGVHEALELHEILVFKTLCATKSSTMAKLTSDPQLKTILGQDVKQSKQHINTLQNHLQSIKL